MGIDILGIDILGIDILAPRSTQLKISRVQCFNFQIEVYIFL